MIDDSDGTTSQVPQLTLHKRVGEPDYLGAYKIIQGLGVSDIIGHCSIGLLIIWHYSRLFQIWKEILHACLSLTWIIQWGLSTPN